MVGDNSYCDISVITPICGYDYAITRNASAKVPPEWARVRGGAVVVFVSVYGFVSAFVCLFFSLCVSCCVVFRHIVAG